MSDSALAVSALSHAMRGNQNKAPGRPFSDTLRTVLFTDKKKRMTAVVHALVAKAEEGDIPAIKEIADRIEGKVSSQEQAQIKIIIHKDMSELQAIDVTASVVAPLDEIVDPELSQEVESGHDKAIKRHEAHRRRKDRQKKRDNE